MSQKSAKRFRKICLETSVNPDDSKTRYKQLKANYAATPSNAKGQLNKTLEKAATILKESMKKINIST